MTLNPFKVESSDQSLNLPSKSPGLHCHSAVLENGLKVLITENPAADIISARLLLDAGGRRDSAQVGLSRMVAEVLTKGTATASARSIAAQIESTGSSLGVDSAPDYFLLALKTVSTEFAALLKLAAELIQTPTFPPEELELERKLLLRSIQARQEQPMAIALQQLLSAVHPHHSYGQPSLGTAESLAQLTRSDLIEFHAGFFRPEQSVLSIAGNISVSVALDLVVEQFGAWRGGEMPSFAMVDSTFGITSVCNTFQDNRQSIVMLGYPAAAVQDEDFVALKVLQTYLCSGLSSRLFTELREKRGLAYEVSGFYPTRLDPSHFVVYLGTAADNTALAQALLQAEMDRLFNDPLSEAALSIAKQKLLGQYALGRQTNHQIAQSYGWYEFLGLGIDYTARFPQLVRAVTPELAHRAARRCFERPFVSRVGPQQALTTA